MYQHILLYILLGACVELTDACAYRVCALCVAQVEAISSSRVKSSGVKWSQVESSQVEAMSSSQLESSQVESSQVESSGGEANAAGSIAARDEAGPSHEAMQVHLHIHAIHMEICCSCQDRMCSTCATPHLRASSPANPDLT